MRFGYPRGELHELQDLQGYNSQGRNNKAGKEGSPANTGGEAETPENHWESAP